MTPARRILLAIVCAGGCGDDPPRDYLTDHLIVEPEDSKVLCDGSLDDWETQVLRVAAALKLDVPYPITVYFGQSAVDEHCTPRPDFNLGGCTGSAGDETYIAALHPSVYHELVHAVRRTNGIRGPSFFEEGIAVVLGGFRPYPITVMPDPASLPPDQGPHALATSAVSQIPSESYGVAGHFTAWLIATYGQDTVAAFLNDPALADTTEDVFTAHFGLPLADAEQAWRANSEPEYTFGQVCDPDRALAWDGDTIEYSAQLACDAPHVLGPDLNTITLRSTCFSLEQPVTLHVELLASAGGASFRQNGDCLALAGVPKEHFQGKTLLAGETMDLPFAPCAWEVSLSTELTAETDFTLRLTR